MAVPGTSVVQDLMGATVVVVGCGDVGLRAAHCLHERGAQVYGVKRQVAGLPAWINAIAADITRPETLAPLASITADYLIVATSPGAFNEQAYQAVYVEGLANVLAVLKPRRRLLLVSSTSVYGQSQHEWVDEHSETLASGFSGRLQKLAEDTAYRLCPHTTVVRFAGIYGPGRYRLIEQVAQGIHTPVEPPQYSNRIHVVDCAGVLAFLLGLDWAGKTLAFCYVGVDHEPVPLHEVKNWLAQAMGLSGHWLRSEVATSRGGSKRCRNQRLLAAGYRFHYPSYREGYRELVAEWQSQSR